MKSVKKKMIQIFANGSLIFNTTYLKKKKVKVNKTDHVTFILNKKNFKLMTTNAKDFENFKTRYLKF
jgi:hypothetical protein